MSQLDLASIQLLAFPFVILIAFRLRVFGARLPIVLLFLSALCAGAAAAWSYRGHLLGRTGAVMGRLSGDVYESDTRIFREKVNSERVHGAGSLLDRYHAEIGSHADAERIMASSETDSVAVWGSKRWLTISFERQDPLDLGAETLGAAARLVGLDVVTSVPALGLSFEPQQDTALFVSRLLEAHLLDGNPGTKEMLLAEAASLAATWTSFAHRAHAHWQLGNLHLMEALSGDRPQPGALKCAYDDYARARSHLRYGDNADLLAAIHNNLAVTIYARYLFEGRRDLLPLARRNLRKASLTLSHPNPLGVKYRSALVARQNLRELRSALRKRGPRNNKIGARRTRIHEGNDHRPADSRANPTRPRKHRSAARAPKVRRQGSGQLHTGRRAKAARDDGSTELLRPRRHLRAVQGTGSERARRPLVRPE